MSRWSSRRTAGFRGLLGALLWTVPSSSAIAQDVNKALDEIAATANRLCDVVREAGTAESAEVKDSVKIQVEGLTRTVESLGVPGTGRLSSKADQGLLRRDLATALIDRQRCRFDVFMTLQAKLIPDMNFAQPAPAEEQKAVAERPEPAQEREQVVAERPRILQGPEAPETPVVAEQPAPAKLPPSETGPLRTRSIFIHHRATSQEGQHTASNLKQQLSPLAGYTEIRAVQVLPDAPSVRYFYKEDADAAGHLASLLDPGGGPWIVKGFTTYEPRPRPGLLEIWIPAR